MAVQDMACGFTYKQEIIVVIYIWCIRDNNDTAHPCKDMSWLGSILAEAHPTFPGSQGQAY